MQNKKAYTIIEVLIVISIITVLLSVIAIISVYRAKKLKTDISTSQEMKTQGESLSPDAFKLNAQISSFQKKLDLRLLNDLEEKRTPLAFRVSQGISYNSGNEKETTKLIRQLLTSAVIKAKEQKPKEALAMLREASILSPLDPEIATQSARIAMLVGESNFALNKVNEALSFNPEYANAYIVRARLYLLSENHQKAFDDLNKASELKQNGPEIFLVFSEYYLKTGQEEKAQESLEHYRSLGGKT